MKKRIFLFLAVIMGIIPGIKAEEETCFNPETQQAVEEVAPLYRSIYAELFGASNLIGISYDSRIKPGSPFGYRGGISYVAGYQYILFYSDKMSGFAIPLEFNCILGKRKSKFEIGLGVNLGVYSTEQSLFLDENGYPSIFEPAYKVTVSRNTFGYYFFSNIGYRYQRKNGFMLRVGVSPSFSFAGPHAVKKDPFLYPYLSLGYTIGNK